EAAGAQVLTGRLRMSRTMTPIQARAAGLSALAALSDMDSPKDSRGARFDVGFHASRTHSRGLLGRCGDRSGDKVEFDRRRVPEDVQDRAVRVDDRLEFRQVLWRRGALQRHVPTNPGEPRTGVIADREEAAEVQTAF